MANLTIKNIPEDLYQKLKKSAEINRRSINAEVIFCLEHLLAQPQEDIQTLLDSLRSLRAKSVRHFLTDEDIALAQQFAIHLVTADRKILKEFPAIAISLDSF